MIYVQTIYRREDFPACFYIRIQLCRLQNYYGFFVIHRVFFSQKNTAIASPTAVFYLYILNCFFHFCM